MRDPMARADRDAARHVLHGLKGRDPRQRDSVLATVQHILGVYAEPDVQRNEHGGRRINAADWLRGDHSIFIVAAAHDQHRLRPAIVVLVQQLFAAAFDTALRHGGALERPLLVLLDEAGNIAPLNELPLYAATARSHAITLVTVWQDLAQLHALYGPRAQTVLNNHRAKLFGTGIADTATLEYLRRLVGDQPHTQRRQSIEMTGGRRTISEHTSYRAVAPIDALRRLDPRDALLVYGHHLPARITLRPWYQTKTLRHLAEV